jgi:phytanoyl-CoA hydroxylase
MTSFQTKFTTGDEEDQTKKHVGDEYFLTSGDKIRYFLEEEAVGADGKLNRPKELAVNKIGHGRLYITTYILCLHDLALHELDPVFRDVTLNNPKLRALAKDLRFHSNPLGTCIPLRFRIVSQCDLRSAAEYGHLQAT